MHVLVVDDDPLSLHMVDYRLRQWGHEVVTCANGEEAWEKIESGYLPHAAVLDWMMPGLNGLELCQKIRARSDGPYVYIILLTGKGETEDVIEGLEAGADDYLTKPLHFGELKVRLRTGQRIVNLQADLMAAHESLRVQARQDSLTHALNHGAILDYLQREQARAKREHLPLSLIMADLDEFKRINDQYGHLAGDYVLVEVTSRLHDCLRPYDAIGRYGGDEFLVVLPGSDSRTVLQQAERIQASLANDPIHLSEREFFVTMSLGLTTWTEPYVGDAKFLIHAVDEALYSVKNNGRNGVEFASFNKEGGLTRQLLPSVY